MGIVSLGGVFGSIGVSLLARFVSIRLLMIAVLLTAGFAVGVFPQFTDSLANMKAVGFVAGVGLFAALSGFYGLFATGFPSSLVGSGTGLVIGFGRGGAVLGPMIPGFLFAAGFPLQAVAILLALGSILGGISIVFLKTQRLGNGAIEAV